MNIIELCKESLLLQKVLHNETQLTKMKYKPKPKYKNNYIKNKRKCWISLQKRKNSQNNCFTIKLHNYVYYLNTKHSVTAYEINYIASRQQFRLYSENGLLLTFKPSGEITGGTLENEIPVSNINEIDQEFMFLLKLKDII